MFCPRRLTARAFFPVTLDPAKEARILIARHILRRAMSCGQIMGAKTSRDEALGEDSDRLLARTRHAMGGIGGISELKMFGGVGFLLNGNLVAGASKRGLLLRLGKERYVEALLCPGVNPMVMRGKEMPGYVYL